MHTKRARLSLGSSLFAIGAFLLYRQLYNKQSQSQASKVPAGTEIKVSTLSPRPGDIVQPTMAVSDELESRLESSFRDVYLQLLSVIQGVAFGFLATITLSNAASLKTSNWFALLTCLVVILIIWQEYMVGSTAFAWIPTILDTITPFGLGIIEFAMIGFAVGPTRPFLLVMLIAFLLGMVAVANWWFHAKRGFPINNSSYPLLGRYIRFTFLANLVGFAVVSPLVVLSLSLNNGIFDLISAICVFATVVPQLFHSIWDWNVPLRKARMNQL